MHREIVLSKENWQLAKYEPRPEDTNRAGAKTPAPAVDGLQWISAEVPGAVHYDLVREGILRNPFASSQAAVDAGWVAESNWLFKREFDLDAALTDDAWGIFEFRGIDTFSDIWLNGRYLGATLNAYRSFSFRPAPGTLLSKGNILLVLVKAHSSGIASKIPGASRMHLSGPVSGLLGKSLIRRYQRNFFTNSSLLNLGTGVLGIGIYKDVVLHLHALARIAGSLIRTESVATAEAKLSVGMTIESLPHKQDTSKGMRVTAVLKECASGVDAARGEVKTVNGTEAARGEAEVGGGVDVTIPLVVHYPKLWWPKGQGAQNLYDLTLVLYNGEEAIDQLSLRTGIRQVELVRKRKNARPAFFFRINGKEVYCRGFNLIPPDYLKVHGSPQDYENLIALINNTDANTIRLWGGGAVENDRFYRACDEAGIMLWQDFFLHSNVYPDDDPEFVENFRLEARELVGRVRNHPSLILFCGGNEQYEGWEEWGWKEEMDRFYGETLVTEVLPEITASLSPEIPYVVNSPCGEPRAQSPVDGDMHCWGNFFNAVKDPQFVTETCWTTESYSRPETLLKTMGLDVDKHDKPGWFDEWHRITGLPKITRFPYSSYFDVTTLRGYLRSLEIEQAMADYHALSMLRLRSSDCRGILYWSLNKGGPLFGFGCVDYLGYPLMSYYIVKRLFADILLGMYLDIDDVRIVCSNESGRDIRGTLVVEHFCIDGKRLKVWKTEVEIPQGGHKRLQDLPGYYKQILDRTNEVLHARLIVVGETISRDTLLFCPFAELKGPTKPVNVSLGKDERERVRVHLESTEVCKMIEIEADTKVMLDDNYFTLIPGDKRKVMVTALAGAEHLTRLFIRAADGSRGEFSLRF